MTSVKPGEGARFLCPNDEKLLALSKSESTTPDLWVLPLSDVEVFVAPLKYGRFQTIISCTQNTQIEVDLEVKAPPPPQEKPTLSPPDTPYGLIQAPYPMSFLFFWGAVFLFFLISGFVAYRRYTNFKRRNVSPEETPDPRQAEHLWFEVLNRLKTLHPKDSAFYSELVTKFRGWLELEFQFSAAWASTPEFMGVFKSATLGSKLDSSFYLVVERLLYNLDTIRFAKKEPSKQEIEALILDFESLVPTVREP